MSNLYCLSGGVKGAAVATPSVAQHRGWTPEKRQEAEVRFAAFCARLGDILASRGQLRAVYQLHGNLAVARTVLIFARRNGWERERTRQVADLVREIDHTTRCRHTGRSFCWLRDTPR
jgi:hypothetical protein